MFSFKSALAGAALSLALVGGVSAVRAQTSPQPMSSTHPMTSARPMTPMPGMNGGMMQMMNDPVAMCDQMMHAIATDPVMHENERLDAQSDERLAAEASITKPGVAK